VLNFPLPFFLRIRKPVVDHLLASTDGRLLLGSCLNPRTSSRTLDRLCLWAELKLKEAENHAKVQEGGVSRESLVPMTDANVTKFGLL
jgi:hypothetical protein